MYRAEPSLTFFSAVVKNAASANLEVKKLVYIYLVHHAEAEPDMALLSINAIQKSLTDQNPQVRTMALRTMSGIRVPVISQIVSLAIKRGCGDMSPHVRKAAALAIPKCYRLDPSTLPQLTGYISTLLGDSQYFVVGPAVAAFLEVCPDQIDLIHKHYRSLVKKLVDMDEWGQLATLRLLTSYARKCFPRRTQKVKQAVTKPFYDDEPQGSAQGDEEEHEVPVLDSDLEILLRACKLLLQNRNSAVIVSVVRCFLHLAPPEYLSSAIGPLVALLRSPQDMQLIALYNIVVVALRDPKPFARYVAHFLIHANDAPHIWRLKLEVLTIIFPHCGKHWKGVIISELEHFSKGTDPELVRESVRAIGRCAQGDVSTADMCLRILLGQISSLDENLVSESLTVIRHLIQQDPASHKQTVIQLVAHLGTTSHPDARATIIWLVGEFAGMDWGHNIAPDVLRVLIKGFADETEVVKQQIVLLGAKVYLHHLLQKSSEENEKEPASSTSPKPAADLEQEIRNEWSDDRAEEPKDNDHPPEEEQDVNDEIAPKEEDRITLLWRYILLLARYDTSYDLRDRARLYKALLASPSSTQLANLLLLAPKPVPHAPSPSETRKDLLIGTATLVVGQEAGYHGLRGYAKLPDWVEPGKEPDPSLRTEEVRSDTTATQSTMTAGEKLDRALREHETTAPPRRRNGASVAGGPSGKKTLDQWLDEEDEEETESETESEGETDSDEYETDSEEESEEEDEEEEDEADTDSESEAVHKEAQQLLVQPSSGA